MTLIVHVKINPDSPYLEYIERVRYFNPLLAIAQRWAGPDVVGRAKSNKFKNRYPPGVRPSTAKSATWIPITATKRQELGMPGMKLLPNLQLIKRLEG